MTKKTLGLLYVDILGTKKLWQVRGISAGMGRMDLFANSIKQGTESAIKRYCIRLVEGSIWTDSAALLFESIDDAILAGTTIFQNAFSRDNHERDARLYLRGVITRASNDAVSSSVESDQDLPTLSRVIFSEEQIAATILENSGFRGMRLIGSRSDLSEESVAGATQRFWRSVEEAGEPSIVGHLHGNLYPNYPERMLDVLWPADTKSKFQDRKTRFLNRFVASKGDSEEKRQLRPMNALFGVTERVLG